MAFFGVWLGAGPGFRLMPAWLRFLLLFGVLTSRILAGFGR
jgi:hypothetical protein